MRAVVQRVASSSVKVEQEIVGSTDIGLLVLLGVGDADTEKDANYIAQKIAKLRIFNDENGKMNKSVTEADGSVCIVSQFTLFGDVRQSNRPGFDQAARPEKAQELYERVVAEVQKLGIRTSTGTFRAHMQVSLVNDGPVTILIDSQKNF